MEWELQKSEITPPWSVPQTLLAQKTKYESMNILQFLNSSDVMLLEPFVLCESLITFTSVGIWVPFDFKMCLNSRQWKICAFLCFCVTKPRLFVYVTGKEMLFNKPNKTFLNAWEDVDCVSSHLECKVLSSQSSWGKRWDFYQETPKVGLKSSEGVLIWGHKYLENVINAFFSFLFSFSF